jgi:hypothetical protein
MGESLNGKSNKPSKLANCNSRINMPLFDLWLNRGSFEPKS